MRKFACLLAIVCAIAAPAPAQAESVLVTRGQTVTGRVFVRDAFGSRFIDCTPAIYRRREQGRWVFYRREVDCPYPGANAASLMLPMAAPRYRDARFVGINPRNGYIILK